MAQRTRAQQRDNARITAVMAKKVKRYIKLQVPAARRIRAPPVGPALGQHGVNIMEFCKQFNAQTQKHGEGPADPGRDHHGVLDRSFTFIMKTPPASVLLKKAIGIEKGSGTPNTDKVGKITRKQLEEIAKTRAGPDRGRSRRRGSHHRGQRPQHGRRRGGLSHGEGYEAPARPGAREGSARQAVSDRRGAEARQGVRRRRSSTSPSTSP